MLALPTHCRDAILPATEEIADPALPAQTLYNRWHEAGARHRKCAVPGGGSDFEPFLYELGIPIMQVGFHGVFGVYHSGFDDMN